ncbi:RtcB family protein [Paracoccus caeni]|uniref:3'-phosphate/5'-hydroxy nucleic acid ligase n=1 Tax=Paracoccus caeni TaxID=657651 RepID=A0A934VTU1_9RHOB|nr:RtcB family protein [Paracoccus caeni]MBK4215101.1 RtcB family protein [Paracoccus caeni]
MKFTGKDLIDLGIQPGQYFSAMLDEANATGVLDRSTLEKHLPTPALMLIDGRSFSLLADATDDDEQANLDAVSTTMQELIRTPVVRGAAAMPDACPAGPVGTIPVGGVISSEAIHPGMHSADICCSVAISIFPGKSPAEVLDTVHSATHFGPGGRKDMPMPAEIAALVDGNPLTRPLFDIANHHFGTQGDGNHFAFVGTLKSTGETALVTHHGSRGFGAKLYKSGMRIAENYRRKLSPDTLKGNAWIPADTLDGEDYWEALQIIRAWTKANHAAIHDAVGTPSDRFWNEHNFVFRKSDGLFYHGKGATPAFDGWADDATELTLIPLNMAQPVLIVRGRNNPAALGFSPHGAGRNFSRSEHRRRGMGDLIAETAGIDARFFSGIPDPTELPSGYKNADEVRRQIERYDLAEVVDEVLPYGCIMAGDWEQEAPWRKKDSA